MPALFLPGPFAEADLLGAALGAAPGRAAPVEAPRLRAATLAGFALLADPHGPAVALASAAGAEVAGAVAEAEGVAAARLRFALGAMGGAVRAEVATSAGPAEAWLAAEGAALAPWPARPDPEWRAHLAEALAEAMAQFGLRDAAETRGQMQGIGYRALARVRGRAAEAPVRARRGFTAAADVEPIAVAYPYARFFGVEEHRFRHRRFDGAMSGEVDRAVFTSGDAVTVVPFDPGRRLVLMIEQFRPGPLARRDPRPWCLEAVAGRCDPGEGPDVTARREAVEEAGLELGRLARVAAYYTSPGTMAEHITAYVGEASLEGVAGVHGLDEEDEDIRVLVMPLAEALALVAAGEVNNAPLLLTLFWLDANADRLAADWGG